MQIVMREIAGQIQSGSFSLQDESYQELKRDYPVLAVTATDIAKGAAYLFGKGPPAKRRGWKAELEIEQYRHVLGTEEGTEPDSCKNTGTCYNINKGRKTDE